MESHKLTMDQCNAGSDQICWQVRFQLFKRLARKCVKQILDQFIQIAQVRLKFVGAIWVTARKFVYIWIHIFEQFTQIPHIEPTKWTLIWNESKNLSKHCQKICQMDLSELVENLLCTCANQFSSYHSNLTNKSDSDSLKGPVRFI